MRHVPIPRRAVAACFAVLALAAASPAAADPRRLADSTSADAWTLPNGLRVVTREVPAAVGVAITVCYHAGTRDDPPGREGLAALLAEVQFTAPAGDIPERTRLEMSGLRPLGWNVRVSRQMTQLSELGTHDQFPGVLRQVAQRMRGVQVSDAALKVAVPVVKRDLAAGYGTALDRALYSQVPELAVGNGEKVVARYASGAGIQGVTAKDVQRRLSAAYVPANAVLAIVGDVRGYDLRKLVAAEFGSIPGGAAPAATRAKPFVPGFYIGTRPDIDAPAGVIGLIAPALADTNHAAFLLGTMLIGGMAKAEWGPPDPPLSTRFQYLIPDELEFARFYPPVGHLSFNTLPIEAMDMKATFPRLMVAIVDDSQIADTREGFEWLLGAPLPLAVSERMVKDAGVLHALASSTAACEMLGGEAFWSVYRRRLDEFNPDRFFRWRDYALDERNQVNIVFTPARGHPPQN